MAEKSNRVDQRAQIAAILATEASANAGAVALFNFPFSIMDKMALNIHRIEYWPELSRLVGTSDYIAMAIVAAKSVASVEDQTDPAIVDSMLVERIDGGTAACFVMKNRPFVKDFSNLPGGGLLVPPNPLGLQIKGSSLANPASCWVRIHYTYLSLTTDEYWQLVEARRVISS